MAMKKKAKSHPKRTAKPLSRMIKSKKSKAKTTARRRAVWKSNRARISGEKAARLLRDLWTDAEYKAKFLSDPASALREAGFELAQGVQVKVHEDSPDTIHLVIPHKPADIKVEDIGKDLESSKACDCFTGKNR